MSEFKITEDWQGEIIEIDDRHFDGRMVPTCEEEQELILRFEYRNVPDTMRPRIRPGATFRWIEGYYRSEATGVNTHVEVFDIDPSPGEATVSQPVQPRLAELLKTSKIARNLPA